LTLENEVPGQVSASILCDLLLKWKALGSDNPMLGSASGEHSYDKKRSESNKKV
jgi:hypothetical protein